MYITIIKHVTDIVHIATYLGKECRKIVIFLMINNFSLIL